MEIVETVGVPEKNRHGGDGWGIGILFNDDDPHEIKHVR